MDKIAMLNQVLAQNPSDAFARYGLAMEKLSRNDAAGALEEFDLLNTQSPDYTPAFQMAGQTLARLGRNDEARQRLLAGIACAQRTGNRRAQAEMQALLDDLELSI